MSTFAATNGITIAKAFEHFHAQNPAIYDLFKRYAYHLLREKGKKLISSKMIINRIRWEKYVETTSKDYRINDAFTPHYARLFIADHPEYKESIEMRFLRS